MDQEPKEQIGKTLYGRRKGKPLRAHLAQTYQEHYDRLDIFGGMGPKPIDPVALFDQAGDLVLEVGFGGGEHLLARALEDPNSNFLGVEPFENGMAKMVRAVVAHNLTNIRLHEGDAREVLAHLPKGSLARAMVLYPDPWPKLRHHKRRFLQEDTLGAIAHCLRPGGLLQVASDIPDYISWVLRHQLHVPELSWQVDHAGCWHEAFPGWPGTRYEAKALRDGRKPCYLTFQRR